MNPLLLDQNILTLLASLGLVAGFGKIILLDARYLVTSDVDIALTFSMLVLLVGLTQSWYLVPDMLAGAGCIGIIVLFIRWWHGRKFGAGDCLVYPLCGLAVGFSSMSSWTLWLAALLIVMPLGWAWRRGKRVWPIRRLRRMIFPATPPAILAVYLTWGVEFVK